MKFLFGLSFRSFLICDLYIFKLEEIFYFRQNAIEEELKYFCVLSS